MSLTSRIANSFSGSPTAHEQRLELKDDGLSEARFSRRRHEIADGQPRHRTALSDTMSQEMVEKEARPPYLHCMIAGGLGGSTGDLLMHSLDTVKTRQQGDLHMPPKYSTMIPSYIKIYKQEGIRRGLYGGWVPALLGSLPGTVIFFGTYEYTKRHMIDYGVTPQLAYLTSGFLADLAASFIYVPSEVLKTRLQLQGRHNNPHFKSGYNYRGFQHAARTIVRQEGFSALFYGYKATIFRDLPFSALQFTFYEQAQKWARQWKNSREIGLPLELMTGAAAGGLAGVITCPLDVVKTRIQTQVHTPVEPTVSSTSVHPRAGLVPVKVESGIAGKTLGQQIRSISTSSPSTHTPRPGCISLDTSSVLTGLKLIYKTEGVAGWFRGVGPRLVWTSVQSGCMLFLYQSILRQLEGSRSAQADEW